MLALTINNAGTLAKLFSESVEAIELAPVEGVRATGGSRLQEIVWGVIPQVAPLWTSFALYRFESNARSATVLGLIGAGGIGQLLFENLEGFRLCAGVGDRAGHRGGGNGDRYPVAADTEEIVVGEELGSEDPRPRNHPGWSSSEYK